MGGRVESSVAERDEIRQELDEVLQSSVFAQSESLKRFLRYVVEAKLEGRGGELKELTLGTEVFGRGDQYDPRIDPIVRVQATRLRSKLREYYAGAGPRPIVIEIPKGAYVPEFLSPKDELRESPPPPETDVVSTGGGGSRWLILGAAVAAIGLLTWALTRTGPGDAEPHEGIRTVAVLPFTDMSPDADYAFYGDSLADEITTTLARLPDLDLIPRTTAFAYRDVELGVLKEQLGVDAAVQGSVRRFGETLLVTAQLIRDDGRQIWAATYDEDDGDAFSVQQRIAYSVADAVERELLPETFQPPEPEAYELYLRGRFEYVKSTPESLQRSIRLYQEAIESDSDFAPAYAGLVQALVLDVLWGQVSPAETRELAREASEHALRLDGGLHAEALAAAAAYALFYEWDFQAASALLDRASAGKANDEVLVIRGMISTADGELELAAEQFTEASRLSPQVPFSRYLIAALAHFSGRPEVALSTLHSLREWAPSFSLGHLLEARIRQSQGDFELALEALEQFDRAVGESALGISARGTLHARSGDRAKAAAAVEALRRVAESRYVPPSMVARVLSVSGQLDEAFAELARGTADRSLSIVMLSADPDFAAVRDDFRYETLWREVRGK